MGPACTGLRAYPIFSGCGSLKSLSRLVNRRVPGPELEISLFGVDLKSPWFVETGVSGMLSKIV
jgi:hypothetical protein